VVLIMASLREELLRCFHVIGRARGTNSNAIKLTVVVGNTDDVGVQGIKKPQVW